MTEHSAPATSRTPVVLLWISLVLDSGILAILLFMPRTGMEAMGAAFLLDPLAAIRVVFAIVCLTLFSRRGHWGLGAYTFVAMGVLVWFWTVSAAMKPTYEPLHQVLRKEARIQVERFSEYLDRRAYDKRRAQQHRADPEHGLLCDLLADERNTCCQHTRSKTMVLFPGPTCPGILIPWSPETPSISPPVTSGRCPSPTAPFAGSTD